MGDGPSVVDQERGNAFRLLRTEVHRQMDREFEQRVQTNPHPTDAEWKIGAFAEQLEPQVRSAIFAMREKGYATLSSGFYGNADMQCIDGQFRVDTLTKEALSVQGVEVEEYPNGYSFIRFFPQDANLAEMTSKWNSIASLLPVKDKPAYPSGTHGAVAFRERFPDQKKIPV